MAMTYTSLVAPKGTAGSIMSWVNYSKLDAVTTLDEAQSLLFGLLRVREMKAEWVFGMSANSSEVDLPARWLDPIGKIRDLTNSFSLAQWLDTEVDQLRAYDTSPAGAFGADPFTTALNSSLVAVHLVAHSLTQGSTLTITDSTATGGLTLNGTFPVVSITDVDHLVIDTDTDASSSATGGGSLAAYTANKLITSVPTKWRVIGSKLQFDAAFEQATQMKQVYYRSPKPLSSSNLSNWLTDRYPKLLRVACLAAAADFMKDDGEYTKNLTALAALVGSTNAENDLYLRGAEFGTDTPTPGDYY